MKFTSDTPRENSRGQFKLGLFHKQKLQIPAINTWSLNIMIISNSQDEIYICDNETLKILSYSFDFSISLKHSISLHPSRGIDSRINHIMLDNSQRLVVLTQSSIIFIFDTSDWAKVPIELDNFNENFEDCSLWSSAICDNLLAVGSNTHLITIWDLSSRTQVNSLMIHSHNIPSLSLNSRGQLASTSIDSQVNVNICGEINLTCTPCTEWGWAVLWISRKSVCVTSTVPSSNIINLSHRYKSQLPTTYFNQNSEVRGNFNVTEVNQYFETLRRRMEGLPADTDSDAESLMEIEPDSTAISASDIFADYLLLQTSKNSVHLIDPGLFPQNDDKMHVLAAYIPNLQVLAGNFARLSLMHFIEKFSLTVVGNQFGFEILFLRVCKAKDEKNKLGWNYSFFMEMSVVLDGRVLGIDVKEINGVGFVYAMTETMSFYVFRVTKKDFEKIRVINL